MLDLMDPCGAGRWGISRGAELGRNRAVHDLALAHVGQGVRRRIRFYPIGESNYAFGLIAPKEKARGLQPLGPDLGGNLRETGNCRRSSTPCLFL